MKRTSITHYDDVDVRKIVHEEFENTKPKWFVDKLDKLYELIDKIAGEIRDYREEQELNANRISVHTDQLEKHENILKKLTYSVA